MKIDYKKEITKLVEMGFPIEKSLHSIIESDGNISLVQMLIK